MTSPNIIPLQEGEKVIMVETIQRAGIESAVNFFGRTAVEQLVNDNLTVIEEIDPTPASIQVESRNYAS